MGSPPLTDSDWMEEEKVIDNLCNCKFKWENRQLVLVAMHDIEPSNPRSCFHTLVGSTNTGCPPIATEGQISERCSKMVH